MRPPQAWKKLGIGATADRREIKRAYAAKLKTIDPDADPEAFLRLREALDVATLQSEYASYDDYDESEAEKADDSAHSAAFATKDVEVSESIEIIEDPRHRLTEILFGDMPIRPLEVETVELSVRVLDDIQMENIEYFSEIEDWFCWLVANTIRRSDCVIPLVVRHFGWKSKVGSIYSNKMVEAVVARYYDLVLLTALKRPEHVDHGSFMRLSTCQSDPPSILERTLHGAYVANFINRIREKNPTVEWDYNPDMVGHWETEIGSIIGAAPEAAKGCSWYTILLFVVFLLMIAQRVFWG